MSVFYRCVNCKFTYVVKKYPYKLLPNNFQLRYNPDSIFMEAKLLRCTIPLLVFGWVEVAAQRGLFPFLLHRCSSWLLFGATIIHNGILSQNYTRGDPDPWRRPVFIGAKFENGPPLQVLSLSSMCSPQLSPAVQALFHGGKNMKIATLKKLLIRNTCCGCLSFLMVGRPSWSDCWWDC